MKEAIKVLNEMVAIGVINDYAIGGAMGAICEKHQLEIPKGVAG